MQGSSQSLATRHDPSCHCNQLLYQPVLDCANNNPQEERAALAGVHATEEERESYASKYAAAKAYLDAARGAAEHARSCAPAAARGPGRHPHEHHHGLAAQPPVSPRAAGGFKVGAYAAEPLYRAGPFGCGPALGVRAISPSRLAAPGTPLPPASDTASGTLGPGSPGPVMTAFSLDGLSLAGASSLTGGTNSSVLGAALPGAGSPGAAASDVDHPTSYAAAWRANAVATEARAATAAAMAADALEATPAPPTFPAAGGVAAAGVGGVPVAPTSTALAALASQQYAVAAAERIRALVAEMQADRLRHEVR